MYKLSKVVPSVQALFGEMAEDVARDHPVVLRRRKFTVPSLVRTFLFGFLSKPQASDEELAQTAAVFGVKVTPQAIEQRFTPRLVAYLEALFRRATQCYVSGQTALTPLLQRFAAVVLMDSTTIRLPDELRDRFPGCGGSHGGGQAALKLQVQWDLGYGGLRAVGIEAGRGCDYKTPLQHAPLPPGSLRITDLGYFDLEVFKDLGENGVFWLSRLQFGTVVFTAEGRRLELLDWLGQQSGPWVDQPVLIGSECKLSCRLVAWRVPEEVANRRRQKLIESARSKYGRTPTAERLAWCDWTILVTNVPPEKATAREVAVLYRARWQVELLFKRWKSLGLIAELSGSTVVRQMARLWCRLLAVLIQHWLLLTRASSDPRCSLFKACNALGRFALLLARSLDDPKRLEAEIKILGDILATARQNKRKRANAFQLLENPDCLDYVLT